MVENKMNVEDNFFIISSENLDEVQSSFTGFAIIDEEIIFDNDEIQPDKLDGTGAYVYVDRQDDKISIYQDFAGCFGLYLFEDEKDGFFAISNSFLKLAEYLKDIKYLNIDLDYAKSFITASLVSVAYDKTLIKEIQLLPKDYIVTIDSVNKKLNYSIIDYDEQSVELDSPEGIALFDKWSEKWVNIFNNLYSKTKLINLELSGGFDTRTSFALFLSSDIDLNRINVRASKLGTATKEADLVISSKMAKYFGFELNKGLNVNKNFFDDLNDTLSLSFYSRLGFCKQIYWKNGVYEDKMFTIGGFGGAILRYVYNSSSLESFISNQLRYAGNYSDTFMEPTRRILEHDFNEYSKLDYNMSTERDILNYHYILTRNRFHFGKFIVESFLSNEIRLNPLMDSLLYKIKLHNENNENDFRIFALIYSRLAPELLDFEIEGGREISKEALEFAERINEKYPTKNTVKHKKYPKKYLNRTVENNFNQSSISTEDVSNYLTSLFSSDYFKKLFSMYFPEDVYKKLYNNLINAKYKSRDDVVAAISIIIILEIVSYNHLKLNDEPAGWMNSCLEESGNVYLENQPETEVNLKDLEKYYTARIDIKNYGAEDNDIEILSISDEFARVSKPGWLTTSEGIGAKIESTKGVLDLKFRCIGSGKLKIFIRGLDIRDRNRKRFNVYIDYSNFRLNSEIIFERNNIVCHDHPYIYEENVSSGKEFDLHIEWDAFNETSFLE